MVHPAVLLLLKVSPEKHLRLRSWDFDMAQDTNKTLDKGLEMLFQFTERTPSLSVKDMMTLLDLPRSTIYRLLDTLKSKKLIQECGPGRYNLGLGILQLAKIASAGMNLLTIARPIMERLSEETGETVILSSLINNRAICLERIESSQVIKLTFERGKLLPLHAGASASVLLAFMEQEQQKKIIEDLKNEKFIIDLDLFLNRLNRVKEEGYVISNEEVDPGAWAVAAPIIGADGNLLAGLSVAGPKFRINVKQENLITDLLISNVNRINETLKQNEINYI